MDRLLTGGVVLVLLGFLGFAIPVFTTHKTEDVARVGDLKIQTTENTRHDIPPLLSGGVMLVGVVLIAASLYGKR